MVMLAAVQVQHVRLQVRRLKREVAHLTRSYVARLLGAPLHARRS